MSIRPDASGISHEESYTIDNLTCRILPGGHAREYTCHTDAPFIGFGDAAYLLVIILLYIVLISHYKGFFPYLSESFWAFAFCLWLWLKSRVVKHESILSMRDVGIQVRTTYYSGRSVSRFIDRRKIEDIIINEGITMWQIKSYMAILVKDQDRMVVVFEHLLPKLRPVLLDVYWGTRAVIFPEQKSLRTLRKERVI